jgi:hypothetical protein
MVALLALAGCEAPTPTTTAATQVEGAAAEAATACPSQEFEPFLEAFAGNVDLQRAFTVRPLHSDSLDTSADPEPKPVTRMLDEPDIEFPLIADLDQLREEGVSLNTSVIPPDERQVILSKEDAGFQMSFYFRKDGCWQLYKMQDDSI